jgi:hypothetical protein
MVNSVSPTLAPYLLTFLCYALQVFPDVEPDDEFQPEMGYNMKTKFMKGVYTSEEIQQKRENLYKNINEYRYSYPVSSLESEVIDRCCSTNRSNVYE